MGLEPTNYIERVTQVQVFFLMRFLMFKVINIACLVAFSAFCLRSLYFGLSTQDVFAIASTSLILLASTTIQKVFEQKEADKLTKDKKEIEQLQDRIKEVNDRVSTITVGMIRK